MITGEMKNKVDSIWDTIWTGGITSPITVLEQITYLMFMKLLDDNQLKAEANASLLGVPLKNKVFQDGTCVISENPRVETEYKNLRWNIFHNFEPGEMLTNIQTYVFPFIKTIGDGKDTAFSRYMKDTVFLIPTAKVLAKVVDGIDAMDMNNKDIMGDVYEYLLGKIAAAGENGQFRTPRHIINMMVELMQPTLKDSILDPAMGSAGFLLSSAAYISEHQKKELMKTENMRYFKSGLFSGFDTDQSIRAYFEFYRDLYGKEDLDREKILIAFENEMLPFASVAEKVRVIESCTTPVYIPIDQGEALVERLYRGERSRTLFRKLGQYSVNVYPQQLAALREAGAVQSIDGGALYVLADPRRYDSALGLTLDQTETALFI